MVGFLLLLLVVWIVLSVLGFVIKGLLWLGIIGVVLFVVTALIVAARRRSSIRR
ncbi:hypothetical protein [Nakamurella leprariae]|uniref:LPXTG cell wall anchor domain-containing protein n=1 Tax=Nakamurella leprariae TaxID=2803911 RepID=A0A938YCK5_9ACTN|nr:hypothetical protein [Nakamurella leprariae]MBM9468152.1 hypothetical protein [Nakamurella leprariae]